MPKAERHQPLHLQIAAHWEREIRSGRTRPGDRLPSVRELAAEWDVGTQTAARAIDHLRTIGLVATTRGRDAGTFAADIRADQPAVALLEEAELAASTEVATAPDGHEGFTRATELAEAWQQSADRVAHLRGEAAGRIRDDEATILAETLLREDNETVEPATGEPAEEGRRQ